MSSSAETTPTSVSVPKLQTLNYVNVVAYLSNFLVVFFSTRAGLPDNAELSNKYQTLVTPAPYAFAIWGIIFTAELASQTCHQNPEQNITFEKTFVNFCLSLVQI